VTVLGTGDTVNASEVDLPELDAVLVGLVVLEDPAAATIDADWFETPRWQRSARVLLRHRGAGRPLGDMLVASGVLEAAGIDFARTIAAEAVVAALEAAPGWAILRQARERLLRLRLWRLARRLQTIAAADVDVIPRYVARVRDELSRVIA
jgi:hypothetical protein